MAGNTGFFVINGPIGANMQLRTNTGTDIIFQNFALGTEALVSNGFIAVYVQANAGAIGANAQVTISWPTGHASSVATGTYANFSTAFASGDYGWVYKAARVA